MERVIRERMTTQDLDIRHPAEPDQHPSGYGRDQGVLRFFAALPVHGPEQPAGRADAQAPYVRASAPAACRVTARPSRCATYTISHYGRLCPIETPEGPNIGLISYLGDLCALSMTLASSKRPYRIIDKENGRVTDEVRYMTADVEGRIHRLPGDRADRRERLPDQRPYHLPPPRRVRRGRPQGRRSDGRFAAHDGFGLRPAFIPFLDHDDAKPRADGARTCSVRLCRCCAPKHRLLQPHGIQGCR